MSKIVGMDGKSPKRVSAIMSPTGKEQIAPVPSFRCDDCDHINKEFQIL